MQWRGTQQRCPVAVCQGNVEVERVMARLVLRTTRKESSKRAEPQPRRKPQPRRGAETAKRSDWEEWTPLASEAESGSRRLGVVNQ